MTADKAVTTIQKLKEVLAAINGLEGLPIEFGLCRKLGELSKMIESVCKVREAELARGEHEISN